ncbi:G-type lectin S-receptor-like serine/threonine-protein kinase At4g27290 isoform X2 [Aristolochia californica]|uniref:G-type lectin S-receptor-like serine/threonine-protein kinase At4g27290 isoform X2 n=1 Tax=Aristolochia californica TaxID=171875 RepID=UPI0035DDBF3C
MDWSLFAECLLIFLFCSFMVKAQEEADNIVKSIGTNETLISVGGSFALGFFSPGNSTNRYLGIWYNKIPGQTIIWVANRENPLTDATGLFTVAGDGNLAVLDGKGNSLWSSALPRDILEGKNTSFLLQDSGNLALLDEKEVILWQSFDNPSDTYITGMRLRLNLTSGVAKGLTSWKDANDPSPGEYSVRLDPLWPAQLIMTKGSARYWRSTWLTGRIFTELMANGRNFASYLTVVTVKDEMVLTITLSDVSLVSRFVLNLSGTVDQLTWPEGSNSWDLVWSRPKIPCHRYAHCGPFGVCNRSNATECGCLSGFVPRNKAEWEKGNWSAGCMRRTALECQNRDGFLILQKIKLPDLPTSLNNLSASQCQSQCLSSCSCMAYSFANVSFPPSPRCLIWTGNLMDLEENYTTGQDLYVHLAQSELDGLRMGTSRKSRHLIAILLPIAVTGVLISVIFACILRRKFKSKGRREIIRGDFDSSIDDLPLLSFASIVSATDNFSSENKLGEGGFGPVYKGEFRHGQLVAVKRLSQSSGQGLEEFKNELQLIAKLQHRNLVRLLGWCIHGREKILVYEFMPNKSLDKFLFEPAQQAHLDWSKRFHIAEGIAQGLLYLHRYSRLKVIHRDLKASNILLDAAMKPKISDFGLARIFGGNQTQANTNRVVGTYGYMSPEYALDGLFSEKSDVFSFGVILLEIVSGKRSTGFYPFKHSLNLLGYVSLVAVERE